MINTNCLEGELLEHFIQRYDKLYPDGVNILSLSGGDTSFRAISGAGIKVCEMGFTPDIILGVSAGAIASLPIALGLFDVTRKKGDKVTPQEFFVKGKHPVGKKGKPNITALFRVAFGAISLGEQDVKHLLREVITDELWQEYKKGTYADCWVFGVHMKGGRVEAWNLKQAQDREEAFEWVCRSSRIVPIVNAAVGDDGSVVEGYGDGGYIVHNPAGHFLEYMPNLKVKNLISVYARDRDWVDIDTSWCKNFVSVLFRVIAIMSFQVSKKNELEELDEMRKRGVSDKHLMIFLPKLTSSYATGDEIIEAGIRAERKAEEDYLDYTEA